MHSIKELDIERKRILMRVDYNVPIKEGKITDDTRIKATLPTIKYILERKGKLILMSHLGRPKGKKVPELSLKPVAQRLSELLGIEIKFSDCCISDEALKLASGLKEGEVLLLENLRFHPEEEKNDKGFAQKLARYGDVYINDAFAVSHRKHASVHAICEFFTEKGYGFLMEKELKYLKEAMEKPEYPFIAVMGGAKVSDKVELIERIAQKADKLLIGGAMAFTFYKAMGYETGDSLVEEEKIDLARTLLEKFKDKIMLPVDVVIADKFDNDANRKEVSADKIESGWRGLDIGEKTIIKFKEEISRAKTILWNGPLGVFEFDNFSKGTHEIAKAIAEATEKGAITVLGGGDTVAAIEKFGLKDKYTHVSTGGGASLELLAGKELPALKALE